jgi:hypothetical protein
MEWPAVGGEGYIESSQSLISTLWIFDYDLDQAGTG